MQTVTATFIFVLSLIVSTNAADEVPVDSVAVQSGCPKRCPTNEHCGSGNGIVGCDNNLCATLQMQYVGVFQVCPFFARQMCVCNDGYARNDNGKCVRVENCPCKCNEERPACGNTCGQTCDTVDAMCTMDCQQPKPGQCACKSGYVRCTDISFECVPVEICYALKAASATAPIAAK